VLDLVGERRLRFAPLTQAGVASAARIGEAA
jgi:hypothetical protein